MSSKNVQWIIKNEYGKVFGPYGTDAVLRMLDEKTFTGVESIQRFPDGRWMGMSSEPIFNERLLILLEGEVLRDHSTSQVSPIKDQQPPGDQQAHEGNGSKALLSGKTDTSSKAAATNGSQSQDSSVARITQKKMSKRLFHFNSSKRKKKLHKRQLYRQRIGNKTLRA